MLEIRNQPVDLTELTADAKKVIDLIQNQGAAALCVPVAVEITGGTFMPAGKIVASHSRDVTGEFQFTIHEIRGLGRSKRVAEKVVRFTVTEDGIVRRLRAMQKGFDASSTDEIIPRIVWVEDPTIHGVDAVVTQEGEDSSIRFISVPKPGQWRSCVLSKSFSNSPENPQPYLKAAGVFF